jgi:2-oxoglutarate ferredoxin oxidoreductase subunit delta
MKTEHLDIDTSKCAACGQCVDVCPQEALKIVGVKFIINHRHIKVIRPEECMGCFLCVEACPEHAIQENTSGLDVGT